MNPAGGSSDFASLAAAAAGGGTPVDSPAVGVNAMNNPLLPGDSLIGSDDLSQFETQAVDTIIEDLTTLAKASCFFSTAFCAENRAT